MDRQRDGRREKATDRAVIIIFINNLIMPLPL